MDDELRDHRIVEDPDVRALGEALFQPHGRLDLQCCVRRDQRCQLCIWFCEDAWADGLCEDSSGCGCREVEEAARVWEEVVARVLGIYACFECVPNEGDGTLGERQWIARCNLCVE